MQYVSSRGFIIMIMITQVYPSKAPRSVHTIHAHRRPCKHVILSQNNNGNQLCEGQRKKGAVANARQAPAVKRSRTKCVQYGADFVVGTVAKMPPSVKNHRRLYDKDRS